MEDHHRRRVDASEEFNFMTAAEAAEEEMEAQTREGWRRRRRARFTRCLAARGRWPRSRCSGRRLRRMAIGRSTCGVRSGIRCRIGRASPSRLRVALALAAGSALPWREGWRRDTSSCAWGWRRVGASSHRELPGLAVRCSVEERRVERRETMSERDVDFKGGILRPGPDCAVGGEVGGEGLFS